LLVKSLRVRYLNRELVGLQRQFNFLAMEDQNNLCREIERVGAKVVFLDSEATVMRGDAIDADFHEARNSFSQGLRYAGLCIVELHEAGKIGAQRGIRRNDDLLDVQIDLRMVEGLEPAGQNLMFELTYTKVRHAGLIPAADGGFGGW
jgi:hypothetical protein